MADPVLRHRLARHDDVAALTELMERAIAELQKPFLDAAQIAASRTLMGLDSQLIDDRTYFVVEQDASLAGCGGWSRRQTMYGGDRSPGRDAALLDPASDAARVRAMYTHPAFVRRGVGRLILALCEDAARAEGFSQRRAGGDPGRPAALRGLRLPAGREVHGRSRRRRGAAGAHDQGPMSAVRRREEQISVVGMREGSRAARGPAACRRRARARAASARCRPSGRA